MHHLEPYLHTLYCLGRQFLVVVAMALYFRCLYYPDYTMDMVEKIKE